jgi:hypothetical protein
MGPKTVERCRNENDDDEEVEPSVHFMRERSNGQNDESAQDGEDSVNYEVKVNQNWGGLSDHHYLPVLGPLPSTKVWGKAPNKRTAIS